MFSTILRDNGRLNFGSYHLVSIFSANSPSLLRGLTAQEPGHHWFPYLPFRNIGIDISYFDS
jgi:hypothetical protein